MISALLTRPLMRLDAEGALETLDVREPALGPPTVLLARPLCRFELFRPAAALSRGQAIAAARLHARTRAPYASSAHRITRRGGLFGIWWWDDAAAREALLEACAAPDARIAPEAFAQPDAQGWRIVAGEGGQEAQAWAEGLLVASAWRRRAFDEGAWAAFVRTAAGEEAPTQPPAPVRLPHISRSPYRRRIVGEIGDGRLAAAALAGAAVALAATSYFAAQGARAANDAGAVRREIARQEQRGAASRRPALIAQARELDAVARLTDRPDALGRLVQVQRTLRTFGLPLESFESGPEQLEVATSASAVAGVDLLVRALEASTGVRDVRPTLDAEHKRLVLRMSVRP